MLNAPRQAQWITLTPTRLKFVSVRLIVTTRLLAPPAMLTVAPQESAVPTHLTVCRASSARRGSGQRGGKDTRHDDRNHVARGEAMKHLNFLKGWKTMDRGPAVSPCPGRIPS